MMMWLVCIAFVLDFFLGDPPFLVKIIGHPVISIGKIIVKMENLLRSQAISQKKTLRFLGVILFFSVQVLALFPWFILLQVAYKMQYFFGFSLELFLCYQLLATRSLKRESLKVYTALKEEDLMKSRLMLSYIVGRETGHLSEEEIAKATVETVAENTTDGVVATLCFMLCFGSLGGIFYKTVNTLDSMVGYRNEKYEDFGKFSAKMDDIANFIPARLTAFSMLIASFFLKLDTRGGWRIFCRDRNVHKSPNAGQTEAVAAGVLGVQLGGDSVYFGEIHKKNTLGEEKRPVNPEDIQKTIALMEISAVVSLMFLCLCRYLLAFFLWT